MDMSVNQHIKLGNTVTNGWFTGTVTEIKRVQDVYSSEEEYNACQETYGHEGRSWEGNEIQTVTITKDNCGVEAFIYEVEEA